MNRTLFSIAAVFGALMPLVFDSALKGAVLLAMAALVALALWRASAAARHLVWLVAVVALLIVPVLSLALPQWRVLPQWAVVERPPKVTQGTEATKRTVAPAPLEDWQPVAEDEPFSEAPAPKRAAAVVSSVPSVSLVPSVPHPWTAKEYLPLAWCVGFALLAGRLIASHLLLRASARGCVVVALAPSPMKGDSSTPPLSRDNGSPKLAAAFADACKRLGIRQRVTLLLDKKRTIPVVWGVFRPRLMLPLEAREWSDEQLCSVLLHELGHIKRRDTLVQWLTQIACALHWWNPLVWLAAWRLHAERERACDDLVLASGVRPSAYAEHLLNVATRLSPARWTSACGLAMARKSSLEGRLMAVLSEKLNRNGVSRALAIAALILGAAIALPVAMLRAADAPKKSAAVYPLAADIFVMDPTAFPQGATTYSSYDEQSNKTGLIIFAWGKCKSSTTSKRDLAWTDAGSITSLDGHVFTFLRSHDTPDLVTVDAVPYDLTKGRVLLLGELGTTRQLPLFPPAIANGTGMTTLARQILALPDYQRETLPPAGFIKEARIQNDTLQLEMSEGETTLVFRVGTQTKAPRFAHFVPSGKAWSFTIGLADGGQPWSERLEIRRANRESLRLPLIASSYFPAGEWVWRTAVIRDGARFTFADIVKADGEKLPVSVETGDRSSSNEAPSFSPSPRSIVRAQFLVYDLAQGAPENVTKMKRADAKRLVGDAVPERLYTDNGKPISNMSITTKSCQQAIIELIRENRYAVSTGGFEVMNTGTTLQLEPDSLTTGVEARGAFQICLHEGIYDSLKSAISSAVPIKGEKPAVLASGKFRQIKHEFSVELAEDEVLVIPLKSEGTYPGTPVAVIELQKFDWRKIKVSKPSWGEIGANEPPPLPSETLPERETWTPPRSEPEPPKSAEAKSGDSPLNVKGRGRILDRNSVVLAETSPEGVRTYPFKALAGHVIGYMQGAPEPSHHTPLAGHTGIEKAADGRLSKGEDVRLTLDARIQSSVEKTLTESGVGRASVVVLDLKSGGVLASASIPCADSNFIAGPTAKSHLDEWSANESGPLVNRSQVASAPGSVFKLVTAAAAARAGISDKTVFDCTGSVTYGNRVFKCWIGAQGGSHGKLDLGGAIKASCNCYFYQLAQKVGLQQLDETAHLLGLGSRSLDGDSDEASGFIPSEAWAKERDIDLSPGFMANTGIGQGYVTATPLQLATMTGFIATAGRSPRTHLMFPMDGEMGVIELGKSGLPPEAFTAIREAMVGNVNEDSGTGKQARSASVKIAGKTGTARHILRTKQLGELHESTGWFVAYAPADAPRFSIAVKVEGARSGGGVCAPIARRILERAIGELPAPQVIEESKGHFDPVTEVAIKSKSEMGVAVTASAAKLTPTMLSGSWSLGKLRREDTAAISFSDERAASVFIGAGGIGLIATIEVAADRLSAKVLNAVSSHFVGSITAGENGTLVFEIAATAKAPARTATLTRAPDDLPRNEYALAHFRLLQKYARENGDLPGGLIGMLDRSLANKDPKLDVLAKRLDATRDWTAKETAEFLDAIAATDNWLDDDRRLLGLENYDIGQHGSPLPAELASLPWGNADDGVHPAPEATGLRAAFTLDPAAASYAQGTQIPVTVHFHNSGTAPLVFPVGFRSMDMAEAQDAQGRKLIAVWTFPNGDNGQMKDGPWKRKYSVLLAPGHWISLTGARLTIAAGRHSDTPDSHGIAMIAPTDTTVKLKWNAMIATWAEGYNKKPFTWKERVAKRIEIVSPMPKSRADREKLLNRVTLDLTGEEPTAAEVAAFIADDAPDALARLTARFQSLPPLARFGGWLKTGEQMFKVTLGATDYRGTVLSANGPGLYELSESVVLHHYGTHANFEFTSPGPEPHPRTIHLNDKENRMAPHGIVWRHGRGVVFVAEKERVRKYDYSVPGKLTKTDLPPGIASIPEELRAELVKAFPAVAMTAPKGAEQRRKLEWSKFPYYETPQIPFANPFIPEDALRLAAAPDKSKEDVKRLVDMVHQATAEKAVELRPLLADEKLQASDDKEGSIGFALAAYDYSVNGNAVALQRLVDGMALEDKRKAETAAWSLVYVDEWEQTMVGWLKHFGRFSTAEEHDLFWNVREFLYPENYAKFVAKRLADAQLDAASLRGVWKGTKDGVSAVIRFGDKAEWEIVQGENVSKDVLTSHTDFTTPKVNLDPPPESKGWIRDGTLDVGEAGALKLRMTANSGGESVQIVLPLTKQADEPKGAATKPPKQEHLWNAKVAAVAYQTEKDVNFVLIHEGFISGRHITTSSETSDEWSIEASVRLVDAEKMKIGQDVEKRKVALKYTSDAPGTLILDGKEYNLTKAGRVFIMRDKGEPVQVDKKMSLREKADLEKLGELIQKTVPESPASGATNRSLWNLSRDMRAERWGTFREVRDTGPFGEHRFSHSVELDSTLLASLERRLSGARILRRDLVDHAPLIASAKKAYAEAVRKYNQAREAYRDGLMPQSEFARAQVEFFQAQREYPLIVGSPGAGASEPKSEPE